MKKLFSSFIIFFLLAFNIQGVYAFSLFKKNKSANTQQEVQTVQENSAAVQDNSVSNETQGTQNAVNVDINNTSENDVKNEKRGFFNFTSKKNEDKKSKK